MLRVKQLCAQAPLPDAVHCAAAPARPLHGCGAFLDADIFVICFAVRCIATGNGYAHRIVIINSTLRLCLRSNICRPAHRCIFYKNAVLAVIGDMGFLFIPGRNVDTRIAPARLTDRGVRKSAPAQSSLADMRREACGAELMRCACGLFSALCRASPVCRGDGREVGG